MSSGYGGPCPGCDNRDAEIARLRRERDKMRPVFGAARDWYTASNPIHPDYRVLSIDEARLINACKAAFGEESSDE